MTKRHYFSEEQILADLHGITRVRLQGWIEEGLVKPERRDGTVRFDEMDRARLELIRMLCEDFEVRDDALSIFTRHLDQLHSLRADMACLLRAIATQPDEVRAAIKRAMEE